MTDCIPCKQAERDPLTHAVNAQCLDCTARMLATGWAMFEMERNGNGEPMKAAIKLHWPNQFELGKSMVRGWAERIKQAKAAGI